MIEYDPVDTVGTEVFLRSVCPGEGCQKTSVRDLLKASFEYEGDAGTDAQYARI